MKIKKGDTVLIINGKSRTKSGKVLRVFPKEEKLIVEGANIVKRHIKPRQATEKGQIIEKPSKIHSSNVKLLCPSCNKPTRVGTASKGTDKYRVCKRCKADIIFSDNENK